MAIEGLLSHGQQIAKKLREDGWDLEVKMIDGGGLNRQSDWLITLKRNKASFQTEYHKGCGLRRWKRMSTFMTSGGGGFTGFWEKYRRIGQSVVGMLPQLKDPAQIFDHRQNAHQQQVINEFSQLTEAEPPTLDEVVYSLSLDASTVRNGETFEEWCGEFGYNDDSIKALNAYNTCRDTLFALLRMQGNLDALNDMFQDY